MTEGGKNALRYEGRDGRVTFPDIGALIGYFAAWRLNREPAGYVLRATFGHVNRVLWDKHERGELPYQREVMVQIGRERRLILEQSDGAVTTLAGNELTMEGLSIREQE